MTSITDSTLPFWRENPVVNIFMYNIHVHTYTCMHMYMYIIYLDLKIFICGTL